MKVSISIPNQSIPKIINGVSANTMFYLINKGHIDNLKEIAEGNTSSIDMPFNIDDFSRCYLAYKTFNWNKENFEDAIKNAQGMKLDICFVNFLENFIKLADLYINDKVKLNSLMKEIFPNGFWG